MWSPFLVWKRHDVLCLLLFRFRSQVSGPGCDWRAISIGKEWQRIEVGVFEERILGALGVESPQLRLIAAIRINDVANVLFRVLSDVFWQLGERRRQWMETWRRHCNPPRVGQAPTECDWVLEL